MNVNPNDVNSIKANFPGYAGWNDAASIIGDFKATGGAGKGGSSNQPQQTNTINPQTSVNSALDSAKQVRQFNIDSAQPQIATLNQNKSNLSTQYQELLKSIKGDQQLASDNATRATNATIAARGLSTQDPMAQQNLAGAQSQATQPYSSLYAQTGAGQIQDENSIASQIAALQAGNPEQAFSGAMQIGGLSQQAAQLAQQQSQFQQSQDLEKQKLQAQVNQANQSAGSDRYTVTGSAGGGYLVLDKYTGKTTQIAGNSGGGGGGGFDTSAWQ